MTCLGCNHSFDYPLFQDAALKIPRHKSVQDRIEVATYLRSQIHHQALVCADLLDNAASCAYGAHPERLYVLLDGIIAYQGGIGPFLYNLNELRQWLDDFQINMATNTDENDNKNNVTAADNVN